MTTAIPAHAVDDDPETAQIECELTGDCEGAAATIAQQASVATPTRGQPRSSATRGFTFQRQTASGPAASPAPTVQVSPRPANRDLSLQRSQAVADFLVASGVQRA